jgi:cell division protein FtsI/penicillin-binding protein 2
LLAAWADQEQLRVVPLPAGRGEILDANGVPLAVSVTEDTVIADPSILAQDGALADAAATLSRLLDRPVGQVRAALDVPGHYAVLPGADGQPLLLDAGQSARVAAAIAAGLLPGVVLSPVVVREYPSGSLAAQVLGFVRASDGSGQYGIEREENAELAGQPGLLYTAVDVNGQPLARAPIRQTVPVAGANVQLTLDANIQYWAEQGLAQAVAATGADGGTVIVMDPTTGAIQALANEPTFNPNDYAAAPLGALADPGVSALYDPGSVMKAITMAAGIQAGVITPDSTFFDPGWTEVDGVTLYNFDRYGHGWENMTQVLEYSANVGAVWVEQQRGGAALLSALRDFGFMAPTGVDLPDEAAGLETPMNSPGEADLGAAENAFGESIGVTPLQMVAAYGALANGGVLMRPYLVAGVTADDGLGATTRFGPHAVRRVVSAATAQAVTQMLVNSARVSEAEMWRIGSYTIAAKTGTSTPYPNDPSWTYATVMGYAPASHPRFVLLVKLDHPRTTIYGGAAAGPLWRALAQQILAYEQVPPDAPGAGN